MLDQEGQQTENAQCASLRTELGTRAVAVMIIGCFVRGIVFTDICVQAAFEDELSGHLDFVRHH